MKGFITEFGLHPYPLTLSLWTDEAAMLRGINAAYKRNNARPDEPFEFRGSAGRCIQSRHCGYIWVGVFAGSLNTLVHELDHAVANVFAMLGMPRNWDTTEASAYLMSHTFERCRNALNDASRKRRRR